MACALGSLGWETATLPEAHGELMSSVVSRERCLCSVWETEGGSGEGGERARERKFRSTPETPVPVVEE